MRINTVCVVLALLTTGACMEEQQPTTEIATEEVAPDLTPEEVAALPLAPESQSDDVVFTPYAQRYCVDQSSAAAFGPFSWPPIGSFQCGAPPYWTHRLSRNHPVHFTGCGNGTYTVVRSLWSGTYYTMRRDAFRPC